ncbi:MAG: hypothetical protein GY863_14445 [bacterium]|nr:hypothetical protein [bacterium]
MSEKKNLSNIVVWGSQNEEKTTSPVRALHDFLIGASLSQKLRKLPDPESLLPYIFECDIEELKARELYDGLNEYKKDEFVVEIMSGPVFTEYKLYGTGVDFDAIMQRLVSAGAENKKPEIPLNIPDIPEEIDEEVLNRKRFDYTGDLQTKDDNLAKKSTIMGAVKGIFGTAGFLAVCIYLGVEAFMPKYEMVAREPDDFMVSQKGIYISYSIDKKLTLFKLAEEDIEFDSTYTFWMPEGSEYSTKIAPEIIKDPAGNAVYEKGNRLVSFESDPTSDYSFVNARMFEFDGFNEGGDVDWAMLGELDRGNPQNILIQAPIREQDGKYLLVLGRTYALLGEVGEGIVPFYETLSDDISYHSALYSIKSQARSQTGLVRVMGQIQKTLTRQEGRNSIDKIIFSFKVDYVRGR